MLDHDIDARLKSMRRQLEDKRKELNQKALKLYEETGKLSDPLLCELAHEFYDLAQAYEDMEITIKENE
ncbi:MAG: hypothetical protein AAGU74_10930 [Bacillota bacterium]